ncbi:MAG: hypothetical protein A4E20_01510 [Nitrospira sp. SG-bin2]|uniref:hypothetical protein n=1 Tax=Nitrospira cf. moscoviensis SBR1015 TaxID=96242 RepID=UPI000A09F8C4|nr:hypothetical protein [Nitrospira cf. moscoviensis SBR1015]OQW34882.1 MAG: hypothetical protein A4E20_01510 [Nitrospira sp. SG-bin2]
MTLSTNKRAEQIRELKKILKPGDTIYTKLNHVSKSGMYRVIDVFIVRKNEPLRLSWSVAEITGMGYDRKHEGVKASGCGMDMGYEVVYQLSHALFGDGYKCKGSKGKCPSNYHVNHRSVVRCPNWCRTSEDKTHRVYDTDTENDIPCTCGGGYIPNPEGPEQFNLIHKDGYALRHRWL